MMTLWSKTKAAICPNYYKPVGIDPKIPHYPSSVKTHPEYLFLPPYGTIQSHYNNIITSKPYSLTGSGLNTTQPSQFLNLESPIRKLARQQNKKERMKKKWHQQDIDAQTIYTAPQSETGKEGLDEWV